jgi:hypothetical protein
MLLERNDERGKISLLVRREVLSSEKEVESAIWLILNVCSTVPDLASHSLTVQSPDPDASVLPSGEKAMAWTQLEWPSSVYSATPDLASHSLIV